jgi:FkbH-like protein
MLTTDNIGQLLKSAREYSKINKDTESNSSLKIAVLGSDSIQFFVMLLKYELSNKGISSEIYEGHYNGIMMDVFDKTSDFYNQKFDLIILLNNLQDVSSFPKIFDEISEVDDYLEYTINFYLNIWRTIENAHNCPIFQTNFVIPPLRKLGNLENNYYFSNTTFVRELNIYLTKKRLNFVTIIDMEALAANIGKYNWFDYPSYFISKSGFRISYLPVVVSVFVKQILALKGFVKKCLILDLDDTLWGGVVSDVGYQGIQLDGNNPVGEAHLFFQKYILALKSRGVILAICSKNDEKIAKEPFLKNKNMLINLEDISCFIANWNDKATNILRISKELNISLDSLVFFDDNPAEREIVNSYLPEVHVINVPNDPALYALQLEIESPFEWRQITSEDLTRTNSYTAEKKRLKSLKNIVNYDEYLISLNMYGSVESPKSEDMVRFSQLINKTNQFNLRTKRYSEIDLINIEKKDISRLLIAKLSDKFGDYGIISCVILKKIGNDCFIDTWVMSCRVLKRGVEFMMFNKIIDVVGEMGCTQIIGEYIPSGKNNLVSDFYETLGFNLIYVAEESTVKKYSRSADKENYQNHINEL